MMGTQILAWIKMYPGRTIFHAVSGIIFVAPNIAIDAALRQLGFDQKGPRKGMLILYRLNHHLVGPSFDN